MQASSGGDTNLQPSFAVNGQNSMKSYLSLVVLLLFAVVGVANAHARLDLSQPAANSTISVLPKNIMLKFNEAVQITALTMQMGEGMQQKIGPLPKTTAKEITLPMPNVKAGTYIIQWRAVGDDTHVVSGKVTFTVVAAK